MQDQTRVGGSAQSSIPHPSERHYGNSECPRHWGKRGDQLLGMSIGASALGNIGQGGMAFMAGVASWATCLSQLAGPVEASRFRIPLSPP
jgi:hypothetical protein